MGSFWVSLKANERIYINGAVLRFDRRTSLEFLNDVQFLLESQVMQAEHANTPLKRLYFVVQVQLMTSDENNGFQSLFDEQLNELLETFEDQQILSELKFIDQLVKQFRFHEAMKSLKKLFSLEKQIFDTIETSFPFDNPAESQMRRRKANA